MAKTYAATYLYSKYAEYERQIYNFVMTGTEIDKSSPEFDDIKYEVRKRQVSNALVKVLESPKIVLLTGKESMSKAFKVFCCKDIKGTNKSAKKVFIDCTNIIVKDDTSGKWVCRRTNIDIFISYLVSAMHTLIYYVDEERIVSNSRMGYSGSQAFSSLFTHVVDYVCKISSIPSCRNKCQYLAVLYYLGNILGRDYTTDSCRSIAKRISGLSDREAGIIDMQLKPESMMNIKYFVEACSTILRLNKLTLDVLIERWMTIYGTGTVFALELFPAFASMITDAYVGAYINNQKSIEKICGSSMVDFTKDILQIGADSV